MKSAVLIPQLPPGQPVYSGKPVEPTPSPNDFVYQYTRPPTPQGKPTFPASATSKGKRPTGAKRSPFFVTRQGYTAKHTEAPCSFL
jgi:hypothetical protein